MHVPHVTSPSGVELLAELGRGAHNVVYKARRHSRYFAVKMPLSSHEEPVERIAQSFLREATSLARVRHPALPEVMEVGWTDGLPYLVMELVAGETLASRLQRGPLEEGRVLEMAIPLAEALHCIHASGLVHRDVSITNILFDAHTDAIRLIDFGFARSVPETPEVAPPQGLEQRQLSGPEVDLFSLGCVLFECATALAPFTGVDPRPLLERGGCSSDLQPYLSRGFAALLRRLMRLDTQPAYTDAPQLLTELRNLASGAESGRRPPASGSGAWGKELAVQLVGRDRELDRLRLAWRTSRLRQGQIVLVRGASGTGKTRLLKAFVDEVVDDAAGCFVFKCTSSEHEPFAWVRRLIHAHLNKIEQLAEPEQQDGFERFRELAGDAAPLLRMLSGRLARVLPHTRAAPRGDGAEEIFAEGLSDFLVKLLNQVTLTTVVIDDVQWLDPGSRQVLSRLTDRQGLRALFVLAARDDDDAWRNVSKLMRSVNPERVWELPLEALDDELIAELIKAYLGHQPYDVDLLRAVVNLSDRTPLGVIEMLRALLEGGALVPYWGRWSFHPEVVASLGIPSQARQLLERRVEALEAGASELLSAAAVLGTSFGPEILAAVCHWSQARAQAALTEARAALLVEGAGDNYRFVHDSVREVLLSKLDDEERRRLHQQVGQALREASPDAGEIMRPGRASTPAHPMDPSKLSLVYAVAWHLSCGLLEEDPEGALDSCSAAGRLAFQSYDNELALRYWSCATRAARKLGRQLSLDDQLSIAEAHLRVGEGEKSAELFRGIAETTDDPLTRAHALSRIAFAYAHQDREKAWQTLDMAFQTLGVRPPSGSAGALIISLLWWLWWVFWPHRVTEDAQERKRLKLLGHLSYQTVRLASYDGKPTHVVEITLRGLAPAERLGASSQRARSYLLYSFVLTALGFKKQGRKYLERGDTLALESGDPVVYAHALQTRAVILSHAGDIKAAVHAGARSLTEYGRWRELNDYCLTAYNQQQVDGLRGRNLEAWKWLERAIDRLTKHDGTVVTLEFIEDSVRAALVALGREREADTLLSRLRETRKASVPRAMSALPSYGSYVRPFTESGRLDEDFEALVRNVRALGYDPKRVHLEMTEYYVHVAHARVHACLRASAEERGRKLEDLDEALTCLKKAARIPLLQAHALVVQGYVAYFRGKDEAAKELFARAQELGESEAAPWVMYAVHRGRAHLARSRGLVELAQDQARLAEALAKEHRAAYRLRWIREEFQLRSVGPQASSSSPSEPLAVSDQQRVRSRVYLRSLVRIDQQPDLSRQQQAKAVVDELLETLGADRGFLFLDRDWPEADDAESREGQSGVTLSVSGVAFESGERYLDLVAARSARGCDTQLSDYHSALVEDLFVLGAREGSDDDVFGAAVADFHSERALLAVPLIMRRQRVGVVYLDRPKRVWPFSEADRETLMSLADQVPLAFELGHSLRARGRAEQTQRSAEKLEAIGRLAGGIAHDFNNMLSVIVSSTEQILSEPLPGTVVDETTTIQSAATRARDLTMQLLSFSRGQYLNPEVVDLNLLIERLHPIFQRLVGSASVDLDLSEDLCTVEADPAQLDQVLTNLVVNAGDAMTDTGVLRIQTRSVDVAEGRGDPSGLRRGRYARVVVSDTGEGMDEVTLRRAFEPFFTTKAARSGTGLGLATAYGIVTQSGGHIGVESKRGVGTTFSIYLPAARHRVIKSEVTRVESAASGKPTILLVDDEPLVRKATGRLLHSLGYDVIGAESGEVALKLANERLDTIDLVLTDVVMPEMNGLDLARELSRLSPSLKVLFMSGFTDGVLAERGVLKPGVMYLQKPIQRDALIHCLNSALGRKAC